MPWRSTKAWFLRRVREYRARQHVRPWALLTPVVVLLVALPLLRPLRHADPRQISDAELSLLATVQSLVEHGTFAIDESSFVPFHAQVEVEEQHYSTQPRVFALLLAGPYWAMRQAGLSFEENPSFIAYLLTVIGVTLPVALASGLVYRMGRIFELRRIWRTGLALSAVMCTGLISYATVLNHHAPAAAAVLCAAACLVHVARTDRPGRSGGWVAGAGFFAALAAVIDPAAAFFLPVMLLVVVAMRWRASLRLGGLLFYSIGAVPPLLLHAVVTVPLTGDLLPPAFHPQLAPAVAVEPDPWVGLTTDELFHGPSGDWLWVGVGRAVRHVFNILLGSHGVLSHFPLAIIALLGVGAVMHRHWPASLKVLASVTGAGLVAGLVLYAGRSAEREMFAARWAVVVLPLLFFWIGAWVRRPHGVVAWSVAGVLAVFSLAVSIVGATHPAPPAGYPTYTPVAAVRMLASPGTIELPGERILAGGRE